MGAGRGIVSGIVEGLNKGVEKYQEGKKRQAVLNSINSNGDIDIVALSNMGLDLKDIFSIMREKRAQEKSDLDVGTRIKKALDDARAEVLRRRMVKGKINLTKLPMGTNPVQVSRAQEQLVSDAAALKGLQPNRSVDKYQIPNRPEMFTDPISTATPTHRKMNLLDSVLSGQSASATPTRNNHRVMIQGQEHAIVSNQKSPYVEFPDAFQEGGIWKVMRNGKKYRIEE